MMEISLYSYEECEKIANSASLRYVSDSTQGILRKKYGKGFAYFYSDGRKLTDKKELNRIRNLKIPPAYVKVWICPFANGHIQATGRDINNRKQYIYHPLWKEARQKLKFEMMIHFGKSIFLIRNHVNEVLNQPPSLNKKQIICAILYLLDTSCIRIGNLTYAQENQTYGLTTLRKKHLSLNKNEAVLKFSGKNSKPWHIILRNKKIVKILKKCEDIPGYELFKYRDENYILNIVTSQDINFYLKNLTKKPFTAKDFRTWIASREFFYRLLQFQNSETLNQFFNSALKEVAFLLGHTTKVCLNSYIHPEIINWWNEGKLEKWHKKRDKKIASLDKDQLLLYWLKSIEQ